MLTSDPVPAGAARYDFWLRWLLPLGLMVLSVLAVGSHYESNDDMLLTYIISDVESLGRVPVLHQTYVFWIGLSEVLRRFYQAAPTVPWYGLTLYAGFYLSVALSFGLLLRTVLRPATATGRLVGLTAFFGFFFLEHLLFFNFTRVTMLLGGAAVLRVLYDLPYFRARPGRLWLPLTGLALALSVRYASVGLMLLLIGPPALALTWRAERARQPLLLRAAVMASLLAGLSTLTYYYVHFYHGLVLDPPELYNQFTAVFDYRNYFFHPNLPPADHWRAEAVKGWICGDGEAFDAHFFDRAGAYDWGRYARETIPFRITEFVTINLNYISQWVLLAVLTWWMARTSSTRRGWWLVVGSAAYFLGLLAAMMLLKLPHRIVASAITLAALALLPLATTLPVREPAFWRRRAVVALLALTAAFHLGRVGVRSVKYHALRARNEQIMAMYDAEYAGKLVVQVTPGILFFHLDPLKYYNLHGVRRLPVDSWTTAFGWFPEHCRTLTGATTWAGAMEAAARRPDTRWVMPISYPHFLMSYLHYVHHIDLELTPATNTPFNKGHLAEFRARLLTAPADSVSRPAGAVAPLPVR